MICKKNRVQTKFSIFILISTIIFILLSIEIKLVNAEERTTIKVGYPIVEGFTDIKNGSYTGYAFDYLFEISKYTGWKLEFIEMPLSEALDKLKSGEIDIVSGMIKNEKTAELFDFPEENSGYTYSTLATLQSNTNISRSDYTTLNGIKIGYFKNSLSKLSKLDEFFKSNNITDITYIQYDSNNDNILINALKNKEVDAIVTGDLLIEDNLKVLTRFDSSPYYFATTKGKTDIVNELNKAIYNLIESSPDFTLNLYNKYFESKMDISVLFTEKEKDYLAKFPSLKAIYIDNFQPIQYYDKTTNMPSGIFIDIFKLIVEKSGIKFEYIKANNYSEAFNLLNEIENSIIIGVPSNYDLGKKNSILFTKSYIDVNILKVYSKKSLNDNSEKILALPFGYGYTDFNEGYKVKYYDTIKDCLDAVEKNEASATYGNYYTISSYMATEYYPNLSIISDTHSTSISLGLSSNADKILLDIFNKVILSINDEDIQNLTYNNINNSKYNVSIKGFFFSNLYLCITVISIIFIIIVSLIGISIKLKFNTLNRTKELLISKSQIDPLTGILNRSAGKELINSYFENFNNLYYGFVILDIDYFKQINDTFGHTIGDEVLKEFSNLLEQFFAHDDIISRLGGDEFIVFMKDIKKDECFEVVSKRLSELCNLMDKELTYNGTTQKISISVGAVINNKASSFNKLYEKSDKLLYKVKRNGRNGFEISNK